MAGGTIDFQNNGTVVITIPGDPVETYAYTIKPDSKVDIFSTKGCFTQPWRLLVYWSSTYYLLPGRGRIHQSFSWYQKIYISIKTLRRYRIVITAWSFFTHTSFHCCESEFCYAFCERRRRIHKNANGRGTAYIKIKKRNGAWQIRLAEKNLDRKFDITYL